MGGRPSSRAPCLKPRLLSKDVSDSFLLCILQLIPPRLAISSISKNPMAMNSIANFLSSQITGINSENTAIFDYCSLVSHFERLLSMSDHVFDETRSTITDQIVDQLHFYLTSNYFKSWRMEELMTVQEMCANKYDKTTVLPDLGNQHEHMSHYLADAAVISDYMMADAYSDLRLLDRADAKRSIVQIDTRTSLKHVQPVYNSIPVISRNALDSCDQLQLLPMITRIPWMAMFVASVETIPLAITVSRLSNHFPHYYPIIYANEKFAELSGMNREDVIRTGAVFMQTERSLDLPNQTSALAFFDEAIDSGRQYENILHCGSAFDQLMLHVVATSPIHDGSGKLIYLITLHLDDCIPGDLCTRRAAMRHILTRIPLV